MKVLRMLGVFASVFLFLAATGVMPSATEIAWAHSGKRVLPYGKSYPAAVERWRPLVKRYFPHQDHGRVSRRLQQEALAIIWAESDGNARCATGSCIGLFQINARAHHLSASRLKDPVYNTKVAARLYASQGMRWRPAWTTARILGLR